jgi:hypothetical protein
MCFVGVAIIAAVVSFPEEQQQQACEKFY